MSERPLVSYLVFSYKQEQFIRDAIRCAVEQTYEPLEIIFSDDCSPDRTFEIIQEEANSYRGPHAIILNRNEKNLGLAGNINQAFQLAHGQFFVMAAGDDISIPDRTELLVNRWLDKDSPVDLVCSYFAEIDINGNPTGYVKKSVKFVPDIHQSVFRWKCGATGACAAYSRKLYDKYGPLDTGVISEDWVFSFRAWLESGIALIEQPLVYHRTHDNCISVIHRNIRTERDKTLKLSRMRNAARGRLGIAQEWLHAWQVARSTKDGHVEKELNQLVKVRELQYCVFDVSRFRALKIAFQVLFCGGGIKEFFHIVIRHVLGYH